MLKIILNPTIHSSSKSTFTIGVSSTKTTALLQV